MIMQVAGFMGMLGLVPALIGLYELIDYTVSRRNKIGIRISNRSRTFGGDAHDPTTGTDARTSRNHLRAIP